MDRVFTYGLACGFDPTRPTLTHPSPFDRQPNTHAQFPYACRVTSLGPFPTENIGQRMGGAGAFSVGTAHRRYDEANGNNVGTEVRADAASTGPLRKSPIEHQTNAYDHSCSCPNVLPTFTPPSNPLSGLPWSGITGRDIPNHGLPNITELFGPRPSPHPNMDYGRSNEASQARNNDQGPGHMPQAARERTMAHSSSSDLSLFSAASSQTVRGPRSTGERRYDFIVALYRICLRASAEYAQSLHRPARLGRTAGPGMRAAPGGLYHPYRRSPLAHPQRRSRQTHGGAKRTLMDHLSVICTYLWRRARADLIAPHRAELRAVRDMGNLYTWSEALINHIENHDAGHDVNDGETDVEDVDPVVTALAVGRMAVNLCRYFRDAEAVSACERVCSELRDMKMAGQQGGESRHGSGYW
jgi:hypothetical protein